MKSHDFFNRKEGNRHTDDNHCITLSDTDVCPMNLLDFLRSDIENTLLVENDKRSDAS